MTADGEIRELTHREAEAAIDSLAGVLHDCVAHGASVSFLWPFEMDNARQYWRQVISGLSRCRLFAAYRKGTLRGTVQLDLSVPPNQNHRGEIRKLLVHSSARRQGLARRLMQRAEADARKAGLTLLTLDTVTGSPAESLYRSLGWQAAGIVPRYAKWPDGRFCDAAFMYKLVG